MVGGLETVEDEMDEGCDELVTSLVVSTLFDIVLMRFEPLP